MTLPPDQLLISADDHLDIHAMPPDVWSSRLPAQWRERGPRVEDTPDGPYWVCDGKRVSPSGRKEAGYIAAHDHGFRPGQPKTRLEDMDRDGVHAQVVYGPNCTQLQVRDASLHEQYGAKVKDRKLDMLPSEIFARQVFTTYEDEKLGVELIPRIGVDNVMWASDHPHGDSTWPHSREALGNSPLAAHGPEVLHKVTCQNAARVYGFQV